MGFKTKLDFSNNRQVKQRIETSTVLSGATYFGVPFSDLPSGVDVTNTGITETQTNLLSTFSGNSATTVFNWFDSRMSLADSYFSAITPSNSATTQNSGNIFVVSNSTTIDGNTVNLEYTGVSFDISTVVIYDLGGGSYSGTVTTPTLNIISGGTIDFTGRTIWVDVSGITRTEKLIITKNPTIGYVWTCIDTEGNGEWQFNSSATTATIWTAGTGTNSAVLAGSDGIGSGFYSVTEGYLNTASNYASHAEGNNTIASGIASHSEGSGTTAIGDYSHAEGIGTSAYGKHSHSEGFGTLAFGKGSHAEGGSYDDNLSGGTASGNGSHAEGGNTIASGLFSHAEGSVSVASGNFSHAEGASTIASGDYSHAEGASTIASGDGSHAGGYGNEVNGLFSFSHFYGQSGVPVYGVSGDTSAILGGSFHKILTNANDSGIFAGYQNEIISGANRSVVLGGQNITATTSDTVYTPNMIINTGGTESRLGINNISPEYTIDAYGSSSARLIYSNSVGGNVFVSGTTGLPRVSVAAGTGSSPTGAGGSIGVRAWDDVTYSPYGEPGDMHVYAGISSNGLNLISADGSGNAADYIRMYAGRSADSGVAADLHIQGTGATQGFIGLGTNNPSVKLHVSGSTRVSGNGRFETIGSSASAGALHYTADGTLTTNTSDERLKTNIQTLTNALDKIKQLRGVSYNWNENPTGDTRIGFIAQEVNSVVPELTFVNKNSEEQYMGVHYDNTVALLVEAVKELSSGSTSVNIFETQRVLAEDNNIELNYNGTPETSIGGGLMVLHAKGQNKSAELITDANGDFITNNDFKPNALTIPIYTPTSSNDETGNDGNITRDDNYLYIKINNEWKRTNLENF